MNTVATFMKVSFSEYKKAMEKYFKFSSEEIKEFYDNIVLPKRATVGSAGYDFKVPFSLKIKPQETILIPSGIRCQMCDGWVLLMFPRSGLGFKYRLQLDNTIGVIDSDYFNSDNEGHIMIKLTNDTNENKTIELDKNQGVCQGIFIPFGITSDDDVINIRNGGFGSTN